MSGFLHDFHFLYPLWLLTLLPLAPALWWLDRMGARGASMGGIVDAALRPFVVARTDVARRASVWLLGGVWLLAVLALAGPAWQRLPAPAQQDPAARVIVLSLAPSMQATDLKPDRLTRARFKIRDLLEQGRAAHNALVAYAGAAFVVAPLTADIDTVLNFLPALKPDIMPIAGARADLGIDKAVALLAQAGFAHGDVIVLTDHVGADAIGAARRAATQGVRVSVLGVGTTGGAPVALPGGGFLKDRAGNILIPRLAQQRLRDLAVAGGGVYQTLSTDNDADVVALLGAAQSGALKSSAPASSARVDRWRDAGPWLLPVLLILAALAFRRGWLVVLALAFVLPSDPAMAAPGWWSDLWRNADQRAAHALAHGGAEAARQQARSPGLRGAAAFRGGDYAAAADAFAQGEGARAHYNLGNALAAEGKYPQALAAWERALHLDPELADARANRQAVEDWLARQKKAEKPKSSGQGDSQSKPSADADKTSTDKASEGGNSGPDQAGTRRDVAGESPNAKQPGKNEKSAGNGKDAEAAGDEDANAKPAADRAGAQAGKQAGSPRAEAGTVKKAPAVATSTPLPTQTAKQVEQQQQDVEDAREALTNALGEPTAEAPPSKAFRLGEAASDAADALPQPMRQALREVPEDPGGLLRRKFMLEYQRQQQEGQ